jgi:two-component SAPR family response regulator
VKLIIIDDEPIQHFILDRMLGRYFSSEKDGTMHSDSGTVILDFLNKHKNNADELPDIIFLDLHMPIMNGWDFLERFKKIRKEISKSINIYVISSSIDPVDISRSKRYSFVKDYIVKPVTLPMLTKIFGDGLPVKN